MKNVLKLLDIFLISLIINDLMKIKGIFRALKYAFDSSSLEVKLYTCYGTL